MSKLFTFEAEPFELSLREFGEQTCHCRNCLAQHAEGEVIEDEDWEEFDFEAPEEEMIADNETAGKTPSRLDIFKRVAKGTFPLKRPPVAMQPARRQTGRSCPSEVDEIIRGWGQYKDQVELLPQAERDKISKIADLIVTSFITPGCVPLGQIIVIGHADHDFHGAAFEKKVSDERAQSVAASLSTSVIKGFRAHKIGHLARGAIAFLPSPTGVGATQPDPANVPRVIDRTLNRRVELRVRHRGAPIPLPDTFDVRVERFLKLLAANKVNPDPTGKRTERAKCILGKIRRPGILDVFVDGTAANQTVGPHRVGGNLCSFQGKYDPPAISNTDLAKFLGTVSSVLKGPGFAPTVPDAKILAGLSALISMINEGIIRVERYITLNSSDFGYVGDKTRGTRLSSIFADHLNDENSIYSCYTDFRGNE